MNNQYVLRHDLISFMLPGHSLPTMVRADNPQFTRIVAAVKEGLMSKVQDLLDPLTTFCRTHSERLNVVDGSLFFDKTLVHTSLTNKIVEMVKRDEDPAKFIKFMDNLLENPEDRAIMELYGFIENNTLPITADGQLLAYKTVRRDFYDHHSGTVLYRPGCTAEMPREDVNNDPEITCSTGIHVCSVNYIRSRFFGGDRNSRLVLVKVNPRDIVSVPVDYANSKVRCCKLSVIAEFNVRSGAELAKVDAAIQSNLHKLINAINLNEDDLREIIGVEAEEDPLGGFGAAGDLVSFMEGSDVVHGWMFARIKPSEAAYGTVESCKKQLEAHIADFYDVDEHTGIIVDLEQLYDQNIALHNRLVIFNVDHDDIQIQLDTKALCLRVKAKVYLVDCNKVEIKGDFWWDTEV